MLQIWRATLFFLSSIAGDEAIIEAVKRLNGFGVPNAVEVIKPGMFSETGCLTVTDMVEFGNWLKELPQVNTAQVVAKIADLTKRRLVKLHLKSAPADKVKDAPCMVPCGTSSRVRGA